MLAAFATFIILKTNAFPHNQPVWDGKPVVEQLWSEWKRFFKPLQMALERDTAASSDHPEYQRLPAQSICLGWQTSCGTDMVGVEALLQAPPDGSGRKTAASSNHPNMFFTAAAAQRYHSILPDLFHRSHDQGGNA